MMICEEFFVWAMKYFWLYFFCVFANIWFMAFEVMRLSYANNAALMRLTNRLSEIEFQVNHSENFSFFFRLPSFAISFKQKKPKKKSIKSLRFWGKNAHEKKKTQHIAKNENLAENIRIWDAHTKKVQAHLAENKKGSSKSNFDSICNKGFTSIYIFSQGAFERSI